jgi:hypothetical protein
MSSKPFSALCLILVLICACGRAGSARPIETSICAITKNPKGFNGKTVLVRASVKTDGPEHMALYDESCSDAGGLVVDPSPADGADLQELRRELPVGDMVAPGRRVLGTFVAIFHWRPDSIGSRSVRLIRAFDVRTVRNEH